MKKNIKKKILVIFIFFFITNIYFYSAIADPSIYVKKYKNKVNTDNEELIFRVIIDILRNPDIQKFLDVNTKNFYEIFKVNYQSKNIFLKLLSNKINVVKPIILTKQVLTLEHLNHIYDKYIEIEKQIEKQKPLEINSIEINNPEISKNLINIIKNEEELSNKIKTLKEKNQGYPPIICNRLSKILTKLYAIAQLLFAIIFYSFPLGLIFVPVLKIVDSMLIIVSSIMIDLECPPYGPPHASFTYEIKNLTVFFNAMSSADFDGLIVAYDWDFDDKTNGTGMSLSHTYLDYGSYNVSLTVTDDDGYTDTVTNLITLV